MQITVGHITQIQIKLKLFKKQNKTPIYCLEGPYEWNKCKISKIVKYDTDDSWKYSHFITVSNNWAIQILELQQVQTKRLRTGLPPVNKKVQQSNYRVNAEIQRDDKLQPTCEEFTHNSPSWIWVGSLTDGISFMYGSSSSSSALLEWTDKYFGDDDDNKPNLN